MKKRILAVTLASFFALSACGEVAINPNPDAPTKTELDKTGSNGVTDLSKMEIPEIIDFVDVEAKAMTALLTTVTDGPSAEAAVEDIRAIIPRLNQAFLSLEKMDPDNMKLSIGTMRKMVKVAKSQSSLFAEMQRISQIPEARAVLEKEFDKIEISKL